MVVYFRNMEEFEGKKLYLNAVTSERSELDRRTAELKGQGYRVGQKDSWCVGVRIFGVYASKEPIRAKKSVPAQ